MAMPSADSDELARFGYKQELDRSLGLFSSFAAGFSYISIMTGVFELFFFGFGSGGPAFIWTWPAVFAGQFLVALCFAELAGQYPLAGSVYQWSKQIARPFTSFFTDSRPVFGTGPAAGGGLWQVSPDRPGLRRLLARFALSFRPPTGFWRDFVVEHSGEHRGQLDLKHGGLIPIVDLARWAGMGAGVTSGSTMERLRAAEAGGTLDRQQAQTLTEAFGLIFSLRLDHQLEQLRRGQEPDDFIDPRELNPLARSYLREAFRAVASVQAGLANELSLGVR